MIDYMRVTKEPLKKDWISLAAQVDDSIFKDALKRCVEVVGENLDTFTYKFPSAGGVDGVYQPTNNADEFLYSDWTSSFWTGMVWLAYELTKDEKFSRTGLIHSESFRQRYETNDILDHHDIGFLYSLSCVAAYKIMGDEFSKETALLAAKKLAGRYRPVAGIIQRSGPMDDDDHPTSGEWIVDCSMNVPLLYWAAQVMGDKKYFDMAYTHIKNVANHMVRESGATHQNFKKDVRTGEPIRGWTSQGDGDDAGCWSRGQAWALYGMPISYAYTGDAGLLEMTKRVANYFLNRLQSDNCANWDFLYQDDNDQRDSSAVSIAACGLLEMAKHLPLTDPDRAVYEAAAKRLTADLIKHYMYQPHEGSNAILKDGVYSYKSDLCVGEPTIWGDYFFMESLVRLTTYFRMYW